MDKNKHPSSFKKLKASWQQQGKNGLPYKLQTTGDIANGTSGSTRGPLTGSLGPGKAFWRDCGLRRVMTFSRAQADVQTLQLGSKTLCELVPGSPSLTLTPISLSLSLSHTHTHTHPHAPDLLNYHVAVGGGASLCHSAAAQHLASRIVSICELANRHLALMPKSTVRSFGGRKTLLKIIVPGSTGLVPKAVRCPSTLGGLGRSTLQPDASISCPINPE